MSGHEVDERRWARENCPVGCPDPGRWNLGCWQCEERYDACDMELPCKKWLQEIEAEAEKAVRRMKWETADVHISFDGRRLKEESTVVRLGFVRTGVQELTEKLLRARRRIAELESLIGGDDEC